MEAQTDTGGVDDLNKLAQSPKLITSYAHIADQFCGKINP